MQKIGIIIPCYNEANRFDDEALIRFTEEHPHVHFYLVNDGSRDETLSKLETLARHKDTIHAIDLKQNLGKANAVRRGIQIAARQGDYAYLGYFDADFSTPLSEILRMLAVAETQKQYAFIIGSRLRRLGSRVERKMLRHYLGRVFSTFVSLILQIGIYDSQCGAKLIRADVVSSLFAKPFEYRWLFDVELLARFILLKGKQAAINDIYELPLEEWIEKDGSKLGLNAYVKVPFQLLKLYWTYGRQIRKQENR